jgi:bis(5'-nucleosyl)-tetraphosphatase (symmetrical)
MAIYAIGDLQGCYDPFRRLLDEVSFDPDKDTLWLTGDLVNRGPKSLKTLRFVKSLGDSAITVLGNHDLHLLALAAGAVRNSKRFQSLWKTLKAKDSDELFDWLRHRPLAHYDESLDTLLVHAGAYPGWSVQKILAHAAEVEQELRAKKHEVLLGKMYGNAPSSWSDSLTGYKRLRFIVNCFTRMRKARKNLVAWYDLPDPKWAGTRVVFGHWSALGLIVLPDLISLDTGCVWGRQLTAVRLDKRVPRVYQVQGQQYDL